MQLAAQRVSPGSSRVISRTAAAAGRAGWMLSALAWIALSSFQGDVGATTTAASSSDILVYEWSLLHSSSSEIRDSSSGMEFGVSCLATVRRRAASANTSSRALFAVHHCKPLRKAGASDGWVVVSDPENDWPAPCDSPLLLDLAVPDVVLAATLAPGASPANRTAAERSLDM